MTIEASPPKVKKTLSSIAEMESIAQKKTFEIVKPVEVEPPKRQVNCIGVQTQTSPSALA